MHRDRDDVVRPPTLIVGNRHVMLWAMDCWFCGAEMANGWVAVSGALPLGAWDAQLTGEPAEIRTMNRRWCDIGKRGAVILLAGRLLRRRERAAALCHECGAVVIDPTVPVGEAQQD
jgi:hypothetical protein